MYLSLVSLYPQVQRHSAPSRQGADGSSWWEAAWAMLPSSPSTSLYTYTSSTVEEVNSAVHIIYRINCITGRCGGGSVPGGGAGAGGGGDGREQQQGAGEAGRHTGAQVGGVTLDCNTGHSTSDSCRVQAVSPDQGHQAGV